MISVANPIYDSIFKFLVEDERVARVLLSAMLKKEVTGIEMRPHEYSNTTRDRISMFRIDFGARVREDDGTERLVLIELQKTWLDTETLRFRQYLGAQYSDKANVRKDDKGRRVALPMIAIYLLGHRVGNITAPVFYVSHNTYDYDGREVPGGMADPFVESLTHDSIIVQIPLLHRKITNRLEKVLSVFDQSARDKNNPQIINIDETLYEGDDDMMYILHRLTAATVNHELRQEMNVEDEFITAIEDRDTAIMTREKLLKVRDQQIEAQGHKIEVQSHKIETQNHQIEAQDQKIETQKRMLRTTIQSLLKSGMTEEQAANTMGITIQELREYGKENDD